MYLNVKITPAKLKKKRERERMQKQMGWKLDQILHIQDKHSGNTHCKNVSFIRYHRNANLNHKKTLYKLTRRSKMKRADHTKY